MSLFYPHRSKPFQGVAAFAHIGEDTTPSQAAVLLSLGAQLRGGHAPLQARAAALRRKGYVAVEPEQAFPVPRLRGVDGPIPFDESRARLKRLHGYTPRARTVAAADEGRYAVAYRDCAQRLFDKPVAANAADLFALCLDHPKALARIAAAIASLPLTSRPEENLKALVQGVQSEDELERELAATGLARYAPAHPALRRFARVRPARRVSKPPETLMLVHGTWATEQPWYQPGGDFHTFVKGLRNDLYGLPDFFRWSGDWSDSGRDAGAVSLQQWVAKRNEQGLDLMGHSHGANVILKATTLGLRVGKAILLSCPVHVDKYFPNFANLTTPVHSVRVHADLVILADGGGQRFRHPDIRETVLPIWFDHSASHDPQVWQKHKVAQTIAL